MASGASASGAATAVGAGQCGYDGIWRMCRELLGPVTAISALDGLLVVAAGKSVEVHEWVR